MGGGVKLLGELASFSSLPSFELWLPSCLVNVVLSFPSAINIAAFFGLLEYSALLGVWTDFVELTNRGQFTGLLKRYILPI